MKISDLKPGQKFKFAFNGSNIYTYKGIAGRYIDTQNKNLDGIELHWLKLNDGMPVLIGGHVEMNGKIIE